MHPNLSPEIRASLEAILSGGHEFTPIRSRGPRQIFRLPALADESLMVKLYHHPSRRQQVRARLGQIGAGHDWQVCSALARAQVPIPSPWGWWYSHPFFPQRTLFVQRWLDHVLPVSQLIRTRQQQGTLAHQWLHQFFVQAGQYLAQMHAQGFHPRDLHPGNVLWSDDGKTPLFLVDYEAVEKLSPWRTPPAHLALGHLSSYFDRLTDQAPVLLARAYCRHRPDHNPTQLAENILRTANHHATARTQRLNRAFADIAAQRQGERHVPDPNQR